MLLNYFHNLLKNFSYGHYRFKLHMRILVNRLLQWYLVLYKYLASGKTSNMLYRGKKKESGDRPTEDFSVKLYTRLSLTNRYSVAGCYFISLHRNNKKNSNPIQIVTHVNPEIILQLQHLQLDRFNSPIRIKRSYLSMFRHVP